MGPAATTVVWSSGCCGRVAEWQTRWLQVPVSFGTWGFKSPFAHRTVRRVVTDIVVETAAMGVVGTASARPRPAQGNPGIDVTIADVGVFTATPLPLALAKLFWTARFNTSQPCEGQTF